MLATERLNALIVAKADALPAGWSASAVAPDTFDGLLQDAKRNAGHITVWTGASEGTIYGDPRVNWAMRAWHDSFHVGLLSDFSLAGERRVALAQAAECERPEDAALLLADVLGQAEYYAQHGSFPTNQVEFVAAYLRDRDAALRSKV